MGGISAVSISLSGMAASASSSARSSGVSGSGLSFFIVLHLRGYYFKTSFRCAEGGGAD
jgi:hypothetical protein